MAKLALKPVLLPRDLAALARLSAWVVLDLQGMPRLLAMENASAIAAADLGLAPEYQRCLMRGVHLHLFMHRLDPASLSASEVFDLAAEFYESDEAEKQYDLSVAMRRILLVDSGSSAWAPGHE